MTELPDSDDDSEWRFDAANVRIYDLTSRDMLSLLPVEALARLSLERTKIVPLWWRREYCEASAETRTYCQNLAEYGYYRSKTGTRFCQLCNYHADQIFGELRRRRKRAK